MNIRRPEITLDGLQIKSLKKARLLAKALTVIEEECGIKECKITLKSIFLCGWIEVDQLANTPMEELLRDLLIK